MRGQKACHEGYSVKWKDKVWSRRARMVKYGGAQLCLIYFIAVYVLPLAGIIRQPFVPFKAATEILICAFPICCGLIIAAEKIVTESISFFLEDEFYVVRIGNRAVAVCCLEMMSVPGSVEQDSNNRPRYNTTMLLALRAGMDSHVTMAYEVGLERDEPFLRVFISIMGTCLTEMEETLKREATRAEAILLACLNNVDLRQLKGESLKAAALSIIGTAALVGTRIGEKGMQTRSAIVFSGNPRIAPSEFTSQIGTFLSTALKQRYSVTLTCVFSSAKGGNDRRKLEAEWKSIQGREKKQEDSLEDQAAKKDLLSQYEQVQAEEGWFDSSVYIVIAAESPTELEVVKEGLKGLAFSVWGGDDNVSISDEKIGGRMACRLLARRHLGRQRMHVSRLAAFVNTPVQTIPVVTAPQIPDFYVPPRELVDNELYIGWTVYGGRLLNKVGLKKEWLREHVAVLGSTGTGKTSLVKRLMAELSMKTDVPWWVFDLKGSEYSDLANVGRQDVMILRPGLDPSFVIGLLDPEADTKEKQAHATFVILRELLREMGTSTELSPAMEKLLRDAILDTAKMPNHGNSVHALIDKINQLADSDRTGIMTRDALLNRLEVLSREPLGSILGGGSHSMVVSSLLSKRVVFDLRYVARTGGMDAARLLYNLVAKRIFDGAMRRGITAELNHVVVLEEANNLVPESYTRQSAADVTTGESMVMLQRATGQGVIVVSTRPNISSNILANTATKITFRLPYDSSVGARFMSLNDTQERYLRMLKVGRALIVTPETDTFELATAPFEVVPPAESIETDIDSEKQDRTQDHAATELGRTEMMQLCAPDSVTAIRTKRAMSSAVTVEHRGVVFDGLGELANQAVAFLASHGVATRDELQNVLTAFNPQIRNDDAAELIQELVSLGSIERESLPLVGGGVLFTLPGKGCDAIREAVIGYVSVRLGRSLSSEENGRLGNEVVIVDDKAILIVPEHLKASSMESVLERIRYQMSTMGNGVTELFVIVRGSVAAARLRELMDRNEEYDAVSVVSAFPSSLDKMIETQLQRSKSGKMQESDTGVSEIGSRMEGTTLKEETAEDNARARSLMQLRLWFGVIQDFVDLSNGKVRWNTLVEFIDTTALQSVKGRSIPMSAYEGKQALTDLLSDGRLVAMRVRNGRAFPSLEEGLWVVGRSAIRDLKTTAVGALESQLLKLNEPIAKGHGCYDLCAGGKSYAVFPSQDQLDILLQLDNEIVCKSCESTQAICILPAAEYLDDEAAKPANLRICELEDVQSIIGRSRSTGDARVRR